MVQPFSIGPYLIGDEHPCLIVAEAGLNHNGDVALALRLIDMAADAGCNLVKFQKRTPALCVPKDQWNVKRDTPWGRMTYLSYRERIEFGTAEYSEIAQHCQKRGILWTASAWDIPSVEFLEGFNVPCHKVPSAMLTNEPLLKAMRRTHKPMLLSTGMSTPEQIERAVQVAYDGLPPHPLVLLHCTSTYPCPPEELNLRCIPALKERYPVIPIGFSSHAVSPTPAIAAAALGAKVIECHVTLDRAMWGSDHAASLEKRGLEILVKGIRLIEKSLGDGQKRVYDSERPVMAKLRG